MILRQHCKQFDDTVMFGKRVQLTHVSGQERWGREQALKESNGIIIQLQRYANSLADFKIDQFPETIPNY